MSSSRRKPTRVERARRWGYQKKAFGKAIGIRDKPLGIGEIEAMVKSHMLRPDKRGKMRLTAKGVLSFWSNEGFPYSWEAMPRSAQVAVRKMILSGMIEADRQIESGKKLESNQYILSSVQEYRSLAHANIVSIRRQSSKLQGSRMPALNELRQVLIHRERRMENLLTVLNGISNYIRTELAQA